MSIEKITLTGHNGYLAMDEDRNQGMFVFYYPPSKKVVMFEMWRKKNGDLKLAYNKRKNCNVNIQPTLAKEVMEIIGIVAGVKVEETPKKPVETDEKPEVEVKSAEVDIKKTIKDIGV